MESVRPQANLPMTGASAGRPVTAMARIRVAVWVLALAAQGMVGPAGAAGTPPNPTASPPAPQSEAGPRVRVELVAERLGIEPGGSFWLGLRQQIAPGWHTYWENPGDSGEPASIDWSLPPGFSAGPIVWPHPERIPAGPFMSYGYEGEVLLLTRVTAPAGLVPGTPVTLRARARWLVCEKECIPEEAALDLTLPVASGPARDAALGRPRSRARGGRCRCRARGPSR